MLELTEKERRYLVAVRLGYKGKWHPFIGIGLLFFLIMSVGATLLAEGRGQSIGSGIGIGMFGFALVQWLNDLPYKSMILRVIDHALGEDEGQP